MILCGGLDVQSESLSVVSCCFFSSRVVLCRQPFLVPAWVFWRHCLSVIGSCDAICSLLFLLLFLDVNDSLSVVRSLSTVAFCCFWTKRFLQNAPRLWFQRNFTLRDLTSLFMTSYMQRLIMYFSLTFFFFSVFSFGDVGKPVDKRLDCWWVSNVLTAWEMLPLLRCSI